MWQWGKSYLFYGIWSQIGRGSPTLVAAKHQILNKTDWYYISSMPEFMTKIGWKCLLAALRQHLLWHHPSIKIVGISSHSVLGSWFFMHGFHLWYFSNIITYQHPLVMQFNFWFLGTLAMLILVLLKRKPYLVHKVLCICFGSFQIHLLVTVYYSASINHDTDLSPIHVLIKTPFLNIRQKLLMSLSQNKYVYLNLFVRVSSN